MHQSDIEAPGPSGPLAGTLLSPGEAGAPVMLLIPGSGPVDRDGNGPAGLAAATYRLLAEGLAERGIASLRIDKRGMFASRSAVPDADSVTMDGYADDLRAWIAAVRARTRARCVWLLGHSEGGLVALHASARLADVCGLVLVAAPGRPLGAVLREQLRANPANAPVLAEALSILARLEGGARVDASGLHPALLPLVRPSVQGFLISQLALDPADLIARIDKPMLVLQGRRDLQVGIADAERLKHAHPAAELALLQDVNHVLKRVASDRIDENIAAYADPSLPLAPGVVDAVADFVLARSEVVPARSR